MTMLFSKVAKRLAAAFFGPEPTNAEVQQAAQVAERTGWGPEWRLPKDVSDVLPHDYPAAARRVFTDKLRRLPMELPASATRVDMMVVEAILHDSREPLLAIRAVRDVLESKEAAGV